MATLAVFLLCASGVCYVYVGYPLLIALLARWRPQAIRRGVCPARGTVVISAHNEGARVASKVRAICQSADARHIEQILVGSDGSTDDTVAQLRALNEPNLEVVAFADRRGKPSVLNDLCRRAAGDVLILTDARQPLADGAISALLENFADPGVGVVSGELVFTADGRPSPTAQGMRSYWGYEKWIRRSESRFRSVPGATGAIYAIRRHLFQPLPVETILDDVWIPMHAIRAGARCCFDGRAMAFDRPSETVDQENRRKRRTLAGNLQLLRLAPWLLDPLRNPIWLEFMSHKMGRLVVPWLLVVGVVVSWVGRADAVMGALLVLQVIGAAVALLGRLVAGVLGRGGWWSATWMFLVLNATALLAWWDFLLGRMQVRWHKGA